MGKLRSQAEPELGAGHLSSSPALLFVLQMGGLGIESQPGPDPHCTGGTTETRERWLAPGPRGPCAVAAPLTLILTLGHGQVVAVLLGLVAGHCKCRPLAAGNAGAEREVNL